MSVAAGDLVHYCAANRPENDADSAGGAVDKTCRLANAAAFGLNGGLQAGAQADFTSSSGSDTGTVAVEGIGPTDLWQTETVTLNGTGHVQTANAYKQICRVQMGLVAVGTVTITQYYSGATHAAITTIPPGEKGFSALFLQRFANAAGGAAKVCYGKIFVVNTNSVSGCASAVESWPIYPADETWTWAMGCDPSTHAQIVNGTESISNRLTAPTNGNPYVWSAITASLSPGAGGNGVLAPGDAQSIWIKASVPAGTAANQNDAITPQANVNTY